MTCYSPLQAWRAKPGTEPKISFSGGNAYLPNPIQIPCGQCVGCRLDRSRFWAVRCIHEAKLHKHNCFVTLTYSDDWLPLSTNGFPTLQPSDMVKFLKRLRKKYGAGIRFFQAGEYGEQLQRPHHHICLFNHSFPDLQIKYTQDFGGHIGRVAYYTSDSLEEIWERGGCEITDLTFNTAAYTARYILKKQTGDKDRVKQHYDDRKPEYVTMSRRPGIGYEYYKHYKDDFYNYDKCVVRDDLILRPPKYYDKMYDIDNPERMKQIKTNREIKAKEIYHTEDYSLRRLHDRGKVVQYNLDKTKKRKYENS